MRTNRDLYQFVSGLAERYPAASLERYLCALWSIARPHAADASLTLPDFVALLERAYTEPAGEPPHGDVPDGDGFAGWEHRIVEQIRDLRAMAANGQLADDQRYFGINSPRGSRWYNFHPAGYLECATVGTFSGRDGEDAVIDTVDWDTFTTFLSCGQSYE